MDRNNKYKIIKGIAALAVGAVTFYGAGLGIAQYYESKSGYDLNGEWVLKLEIESTSYNPYKNLKVGYKIYLSQHEREIVGNGEKWWVNGEEIPFSQHDPIIMKGVISGDSLPLLFTLKGSNRETVGAFNLEFVSDDKLIGTFSTTGANSSGSIIMNRVPSYEKINRTATFSS